MKLPKGDLHFEAMAKVEGSLMTPIYPIWEEYYDRIVFGVRNADIDEVESLFREYFEQAQRELVPRFGDSGVKNGFSFPEMWPIADTVQNSVKSDIPFDLSWLKSAHFDGNSMKENHYPASSILISLAAVALARDFGIAPEYLGATPHIECKGRMFFNSMRHHRGSVYVIAPQLIKALRPEYTTLVDVPSSQVRLPNGLLFFDLRLNQAPLGIYHRCRDIDGCYVTEIEREGKRRWLIHTVSGNESLDSYDIFWNDNKPVDVSLEDSLRSLEFHYKKVDTLIEEDGNNQETRELLEKIYRSDRELEGRDGRRETLGVLFSLLMNIVLYITHPEADKIFWENSKEYRKLERKLLKASGRKKSKLLKELEAGIRNPVVIVGSREPNIIDRKITKEKATKSDEPGACWTVRTLVRGHWRNQPCGTQNKERKLTWIRPHWKGPEDGPINYKKFLVK
jgi:hypothetical protein